MDHHNGRTGGITRTEMEDVELGAGDLDEPALGWIDPLQDNDTGLSDQRQDRQCSHEQHQYHQLNQLHRGYARGAFI